MTPVPALATAPKGTTIAAGSGAIGGRVKRGFAWMFAQTLGNKLISMLAQVALARLLAPEDWGAVGMVLAFTTLVQVLNDTGVRDILIQRQRRYSLWVTPAAWLAGTCGLLACVLILVAAPMVSVWVYDEPTLTTMMWALAPVPFIDALAGVSQAKIQIDMRFRAMAIIAGAGSAGQSVASVIFAAMGFGAWSFILARLILSISICAWSWALSGVKVGRRPMVRRWKYLVGDSLRLIATGVLMLLAFQAGNIMLGIFHGKKEVGSYFFAYMFSISILIPISISVSQVLLPSFARIKDDAERLRRAFVRAAATLAMVIDPLTLWAAAVSTPLVHLLFGHKWDHSIFVLQVLSMAMAVKCGELISMNLLKSQRRFGTVLAFQVVAAGLMLTSVGIGAWHGGAHDAAIGFLVAAAIQGPLALILALRVTHDSARRILEVWATPLAMGVVSMGLGGWVGWWVAGWMRGMLSDDAEIAHRIADVVQIGIAAAVGFPLYSVIMHYLHPAHVREIVGPVVRRLRSRAA